MAAGQPVPCLVPSAVPRGERRYRARSFGYSKMKSAPLRKTNDDMLEWLDDTIRQKTGGSLKDVYAPGFRSIVLRLQDATGAYSAEWISC